jgi:DNA-directed RNA polymerase specialized sigma24 family protein
MPAKKGLKKPSIKDLRRIYDTYGGRSVEFLETVRGFILYVLKRYLGYYDEEAFYSAYSRVLSALEYYDKDRVNLASFIFSVVRNRASSFMYHRRKRDYESEEALEFLEDEGNGYEEVEEVMVYEGALRGMERVKVRGDLRECIRRILKAGEGSSDFRNLIWRSKEGA